MTDERYPPPSSEVATRVLAAFMIFPAGPYVEPLGPHAVVDKPWSSCIAVATEGLKSVVSAAGLPFQLVYDSLFQRRFDRFLAAERIRSLIDIPAGSEIPEKLEIRSYRRANSSMDKFIASAEGADFFRDQVIIELDGHLNSAELMSAAQELLIQTLISTWSVFENFARSFIITWVNCNPKSAQPIIESHGLKDYFGKQVVDMRTISVHQFDLSNSMGHVLFDGRRLEKLATIKNIMKVIFNEPDVLSALGDDLHRLNQRRHLFVHNRGIVDIEYLKKTGDAVSLGERLMIKSCDVEHYLIAVRTAIVAVACAAERQVSANSVFDPKGAVPK